MDPRLVLLHRQMNIFESDFWGADELWRCVEECVAEQISDTAEL